MIFIAYRKYYKLLAWKRLWLPLSFTGRRCRSRPWRSTFRRKGAKFVSWVDGVMDDKLSFFQTTRPNSQAWPHWPEILIITRVKSGSDPSPQEAGIFPVIIEHVWDINPERINGVYPALHEKGSIGSILKGLFGYNGNPTMLEVLTYFLYLMTPCTIWTLAARNKVSHTIFIVMKTLKLPVSSTVEKCRMGM